MDGNSVAGGLVMAVLAGSLTAALSAVWALPVAVAVFVLVQALNWRELTKD